MNEEVVSVGNALSFTALVEGKKGMLVRFQSVEVCAAAPAARFPLGLRHRTPRDRCLMY